MAAKPFDMNNDADRALAYAALGIVPDDEHDHSALDAMNEMGLLD